VAKNENSYTIKLCVMEKLLKDLGERIRDLRKAERLSQEALAEKIGINPKYLG